MDGTVRVAVVGLGWAGRSIWLPRLRDHPAFEVVALVDPDPGTRAEVAAELAAGVGAGVGVDVLAHPAELTRSAVDLAVVAVPNHLHSPVAVGLLAAGVPVFVEKPVCLRTAEAETLAAAELAGGAVLLAGSAARFRADVRALYGIAEQLGTIRHVDVSWVRARGVPDAGGWFTRRDLAGGGALLDLGWHLLDAAAPLVGTDGFVHAVGTVSGDFVADAAWSASWRHPDDAAGSRPGGNVEDTVRAFLVSGTGVSVALRASWASHEPLDGTVVRVEGSAGSAELRCTFGFSPNRHPRSTLTWTKNGTTTSVDVPTEPIGAEYRRQLDELPAQLADPTRRGAAVAQARSTIAAIEKIYESAGLAQSAVPAHTATSALLPAAS
ncbi:oxidoreductase [Parafrankia colletiae]|uniref:Oxidoreductase n=1 Tax=Parafrankia colletiae TaxID=573497 RepID=A0A1S1R5I1_9ACTN|nr:Gfo/Idh/MocA family oxidoreductase [Parafrankia colletiae]OHV41157.1 oxidoreductase [Parafrankia colletiae]